MAKYGIKRYVKSAFNVGGWLGYRSLLENAGFIKRMFVSLFTGNKNQLQVVETFEDAVSRMNLSEEDIDARQLHFLKMSRIYGSLLAVGVIYLFYLLACHYWVASIMMFSFNFMMFSFFFRESFWYLQLRERKLGISFRDWMRGIMQ